MSSVARNAAAVERLDVREQVASARSDALLFIYSNRTFLNCETERCIRRLIKAGDNR